MKSFCNQLLHSGNSFAAFVLLWKILASSMVAALVWTLDFLDKIMTINHLRECMKSIMSVWKVLCVCMLQRKFFICFCLAYLHWCMRVFFNPFGIHLMMPSKAHALLEAWSSGFIDSQGSVWSTFSFVSILWSLWLEWNNHTLHNLIDSLFGVVMTA